MFCVAIIQERKLTGALVLQCSNQGGWDYADNERTGRHVFIQENWSEVLASEELQSRLPCRTMAVAPTSRLPWGSRVGKQKSGALPGSETVSAGLLRGSATKRLQLLQVLCNVVFPVLLLLSEVECGSNSAFMNENTSLLLILLCIFAFGCVSSFGTADPFSV